jgi:hypothetical protein
MVNIQDCGNICVDPGDNPNCPHGTHGSDDGFCELNHELEVRACFMDRCWDAETVHCSDWGQTAKIEEWMTIECEVGAPPVGADADWEIIQEFGPGDKIGNIPELEAAGWILQDIQHWGACSGTVVETSPAGGCTCACNELGDGDYAGFWCPSECTGVQTLPLPSGYTSFQVEIGMHYNNPLCRGVIELNDRVLFDNSHYADHQFIVFDSEGANDMLKLTEYQTCIIHLYTIKGKR